MKVDKAKSLRELNWWKVGGTAEFFAAPQSVDELKEVLKSPEATGPLHILSGGSNILVKEGEIKGLTISLHEMKGVESFGVVKGVNGEERFQVTCLAGTPKAEVARLFMKEKLYPAVFLTGIPGDMGGGVVMNAGVGEMIRPREFCEIVDWIEVLRPQSGELEIIPTEKVHWEYRHSSKWQPGIITRMQVSWPLQPDPKVLDEVRNATRKRVATQPLNMPSGGSTFRNPPGLKAAKLIDECGLKGFKVGGAEVSMKHANFLVNTGNATSNDIHQLIQHVRETVKAQKGVELQCEVIYFGGW